MSEAYACIDNLIPELAIELPGATPLGIATAFGSALREFLSESAAWRVELDAFLCTKINRFTTSILRHQIA